MTSTSPDNAPDSGRQFAAVQVHATKLIARLYDRSAYVSDEEFTEIMSLVKALRQFCGSQDGQGAGA